MPGRRHVVAPGEPRCPAGGCERPAGFATDHLGDGHCLRHEPHPVPAAASPLSRVAPGRAARAGGRRREPTPLDRCPSGSPPAVASDPLAVMGEVLACARRAGYSFEAPWPVAAEAALSYLSRPAAKEWWAVLDGTRTAWRHAYDGTGTPVALSEAVMLESVDGT